MPSGRARSVVRHLSPEALDDAIRQARRSGDATLLQRLCFVKNCYAGDTATSAARRVGVSRTTGARWLDRWNEAGVAGLEPTDREGRPSKLDPAERGAARSRLREAAPLTTEAARGLLDAEFGVAYSAGYLPRLLRSMGFEYVGPDAVSDPDPGPTSEDRRAGVDGRQRFVVPATVENHDT